MKPIYFFSCAVLFAALSAGQAKAQTEPLRPATSTVAPQPENPEQPLPKPNRSTRDNAVTPAAPPAPDPYYFRPTQPVQPSIDRLYQNRMEVDNYVPENKPESIVGPPPSTMQPQQAPGRPGTLGGTGNQGNVGGSTNQNSQRYP